MSKIVHNGPAGFDEIDFKAQYGAVSKHCFETLYKNKTQQC